MWTDFLAIRKAKRSPLTSTALDRIKSEAGKAGITLQAALETCCARGWQGFNADWLQGTSATATPQSARKKHHPSWDNWLQDQGNQATGGGDVIDVMATQVNE